LLSQTLCPNIFKREVFPQPLAPIIDINYPGFANPEIPNKTYFVFPLTLRAFYFLKFD
jgi:hypothetical protein